MFRVLPIVSAKRWRQQPQGRSVFEFMNFILVPPFSERGSQGCASMLGWKHSHMNARRRVLVTCFVLTAIAMLSLHGVSRARSDNLGVVVTGQGTNLAGVRLGFLQITNRGPYPINLPDSCSVQVRGTSKWIDTPTTNLWLEPGKAASISVPAPASSSDWRVGVGYYTESPWNRLKMRLGASSIGPKLPGGVVTVSGAAVWSPWIAQ
jgi:hypothetical protein